MTQWDAVKAERGLKPKDQQEDTAMLAAWLDEPHPEWTAEDHKAWQAMRWWIIGPTEMFRRMGVVLPPPTAPDVVPPGA